MKLRRTLATFTAVLFSGALATSLAVAPAHAAPVGEQSLAAVLSADGNGTFNNCTTTTSSPRPSSASWQPSPTAT